MYKALYRKYRPVSFSDIVGQDVIIKTIQNSIRYNKLAHAYLFCGTRGTGKTSVARLFAKAINCLDIKKNDACNKCQNCLDAINNTATDIIEIDAASNNGVNEIRELRNKINFVPTSFKYKVYIIDEVHMLSMGAFNALLKTLEEPPAHIIFILATTEPHKLPLTIISRCQNFYFKKITEDKIILKLNEIIKKEKISIEEDVIKQIAHSVDGGLRDAISILEQLNLLSEEKIKLEHLYLITASVPKKNICEILLYLYTGQLKELFNEINNLYYQGKDFVCITEEIIIILKGYLLYTKNIEIDESGQDIIKMYNEFKKYLNSEKVYKIIYDLNNNLIMMRNSTQPKIIFELLLLKNIETEDKKEDLEIIKRTKNEPTKKRTQKTNINEQKKIILNNTLALAEKKYLKEITEKWEQLKTYLLNKDYKKTAMMLLDAKVVAASIDHLVLTYKYAGMVTKFDDEIEDNTNLINKIIGRKYVLVSFEEEEWLQLREYYVDLKKRNKKIELMPEEHIKKTQKKTAKISEEAQKALDILGDELIEMKG